VRRDRVLGERDVGRGEDVERRALGDLPLEQARRAEAEGDLLAGLLLPGGTDVLEGDREIGGGGDLERRLRPGARANAAGREPDGERETNPYR